MPALSAAHKAKISQSLKKYHAKCRACHAKDEDDVVKRGRRRMYPKSKEATALAKSVRKGPLKRLRRAGTKAPQKKYATARAKPARKYPKSKAATALAKSVRKGPLKRLRRHS